MTRTILARGCRGALVVAAQRTLLAEALYNDVVDGIYGGVTEKAVRQFQSSAGIKMSGKIDDGTWVTLMKEPVPSLWERCLQLTAAFEGHNYGLIAGNFDGAGLTWGIIGFTLKHGELSEIVLEAFAKDPELVRGVFGENTNGLVQIMRATRDEQLQWADTISTGTRKVRVAEPWASSFYEFGNQADVQAIQVRRAHEMYFVPALETASELQLKTELGVSLSFDAHVQNGGIKAVARKAIDAGRPTLPPGNERALRVLVANAVADNARPAYRSDVRARKLCIAASNGVVHGAPFSLDSLGLGEFGG